MFVKKLVFSSIIGAFALAVIIQIVNVSNLSQTIATASWDWVALSLVMFILVYFARAVRWKIILGNRSRFLNLFHIIQIGYLLNNILPFHLSEGVRALVLQEKEKVQFAYGLSSIVLERTMDVISLLILGIIAISLFPAETKQLEVSGTIENAGILASLLLAVLIAFTIKPQFFIQVIHLTKKVKLLNKSSIKLEEFALSLAEGIKNMSTRKLNLVASFAMTFVIWLVNLLAIYCLFNSIGFNISPLAVLLGFITTMLFLVFPSTPGYVGSYEAFWVGAFLALGYEQLDHVLAVGILSHILFLGVTTSLGVVGMIGLRLQFKHVLSKRL